MKSLGWSSFRFPTSDAWIPLNIQVSRPWFRWPTWWCWLSIISWWEIPWPTEVLSEWFTGQAWFQLSAVSPLSFSHLHVIKTYDPKNGIEDRFMDGNPANIRLQMFSILNEMANASHFRTTSVVFASIGSSAATYILVAITGYLSYGDNIGGNIVGMYSPGLWATIGRAAIVMLVMFSYPLQCHPCRASVDAVLRWRPQPSSNGNDGSPHRHPLLGPRGNRQPEPMSDLRFSIITTTILVLSYVVAMTVSSLQAVLAYVGSTGSTSISFILPGLFYYKISAPDSPTHQRLMKEDDEAAEGILSDDDDSDNDNTGGQSHPLSDSGILRLGIRHWRRSLLRKLSLALAIYGFVVMIVCLITNSLFIASH